jgi:hypothetical protein
VKAEGLEYIEELVFENGAVYKGILSLNIITIFHAIRSNSSPIF